MSDFSNLADNKRKDDKPEEFQYGYDIMLYSGVDSEENNIKREKEKTRTRAGFHRQR